MDLKRFALDSLQWKSNQNIMFSKVSKGTLRDMYYLLKDSSKFEGFINGQTKSLYISSVNSEEYDYENWRDLFDSLDNKSFVDEVNKIFNNSKYKKDQENVIKERLPREYYFEKIKATLKLSRKTVRDLINKNNEYYFDTGQYALQIGWPMIKGKLEKEDSQELKILRAPLFFLEVSINDEKREPEIQVNNDNDLNFKPNMPLILKMYKSFSSKEPDFDEINSIDSPLQKIDLLIKMFKKDLGLSVKYNSKDIFNISPLDKKSRAQLSEEIEKNVFEITNNAALGIFHGVSSAIYDKLKELNDNPKQKKLLEEKFSNSNKQINDEIEEIRSEVLDAPYDLLEMFIDRPINISQKIAIKSSLKNNTIIWGPPGTGKSETIANLVANIINKNKKCLIISEKRAALDVLHERLKELNHLSLFLHDSKEQKKEFFDKIFNMREGIKKIRFGENFKKIDIDAFDINKQISKYKKALKYIYDNSDSFIKLNGVFSKIADINYNFSNFSNLLLDEDKIEFFKKWNHVFVNNKEFLLEKEINGIKSIMSNTDSIFLLRDNLLFFEKNIHNSNLERLMHSADTILKHYDSIDLFKNNIIFLQKNIKMIDFKRLFKVLSEIISNTESLDLYKENILFFEKHISSKELDDLKKNVNLIVNNKYSMDFFKDKESIISKNIKKESFEKLCQNYDEIFKNKAIPLMSFFKENAHFISEDKDTAAYNELANSIKFLVKKEEYIDFFERSMSDLEEFTIRNSDDFKRYRENLINIFKILREADLSNSKIRIEDYIKLFFEENKVILKVNFFNLQYKKTIERTTLKSVESRIIEWLNKNKNVKDIEEAIEFSIKYWESLNLLIKIPRKYYDFSLENLLKISNKYFDELVLLNDLGENKYNDELKEALHLISLNYASYNLILDINEKFVNQKIVKNIELITENYNEFSLIKRINTSQVDEKFKKEFELIIENYESYLLISEIINLEFLSNESIKLILDNYKRIIFLLNFDNESLKNKDFYNNLKDSAKYYETFKKISLLNSNELEEFKEFAKKYDYNKSLIGEYRDNLELADTNIFFHWIKKEKQNISNNIDKLLVEKYHKKMKKLTDEDDSLRTTLNTLAQKAQVNTRYRPSRVLKDEVYNMHLRELFPVWILSPQNAAVYCENVHNSFDYVIYDEASQIYLENALQTMFLGSKFIIAGDPKQLKPSRYLVETFTNSLNQNDNEIEDITEKSFLDEMQGKLSDTRIMLDRHYRSRSSSLIKFSADKYYSEANNELKHITDAKWLEDKAIEVINVDGLWEDQKNTKEANKVIEQLIIAIQSGLYKSIGVLTLNKNQKDEVDELINNGEYSDIFAEFRRNLENKEKLYVKNLENIQGNEAELIIASFTYAKDENGKMPPNYGPLSQDGGSNRLNVALTRAKHKMIIIKSIFSNDISVTEKTKSGIKDFKEFIQLCDDKNNNLTTEIINENIKSSTIKQEMIEEIYRKLESGISTISTLKKHKLTLNKNCKIGSFHFDILILNNEKPLFSIIVDNYKNINSDHSRLFLNFDEQEFLESRNYDIYRINDIAWKTDSKNQLEHIYKKLERKL